MDGPVMVIPSEKFSRSMTEYSTKVWKVDLSNTEQWANPVGCGGSIFEWYMY